MLSIIEKVLILKRIDIFTSTPDPILAEVAELLEEIELPTAFKLFEKGESGRCMYMVVDGHIRIHNDGHTLTDVGPGEVFGEMALLDSAPRVASAMAVEDTLLLKLDQEPFFEILSDRIEVVLGVMRVLSTRLRDRVCEVADLRARLEEMKRRE